MLETSSSYRIWSGDSIICVYAKNEVFVVSFKIMRKKKISAWWKGQHLNLLFWAWKFEAILLTFLWAFSLYQPLLSLPLNLCYWTYQFKDEEGKHCSKHDFSGRMLSLYFLQATILGISVSAFEWNIISASNRGWMFGIFFHTSKVILWRHHLKWTF